MTNYVSLNNEAIIENFKEDCTFLSQRHCSYIKAYSASHPDKHENDNKFVNLFVTGVVLTGSARKLDQSPMPSH